MFQFNYTWEETPFQIASNVTSNATLIVTDTTSLSDQEISVFEYPTASDFMVSIMYSGIIVLIVILIISRHLFTEWDTDKSKNDQGIMPTNLTGKRSR